MKSAVIAFAAVSSLHGCDNKDDNSSSNSTTTGAPSNSTTTHSGPTTTSPTGPTTGSTKPTTSNPNPPTERPTTTDAPTTTSTAAPPKNQCGALGWATEKNSVKCSSAEACNGKPQDENTEVTLTCMDGTIWPSRAALTPAIAGSVDIGTEMTTQTVKCMKHDGGMEWFVQTPYRNGVALSQYDRNCGKIDHEDDTNSDTYSVTRTWTDEVYHGDKNATIACNPLSPLGPRCYAGACCPGTYGEELDGKFFCPSTNPSNYTLYNPADDCSKYLGRDGVSQTQGNYWMWNRNYASLAETFDGSKAPVPNDDGRQCNAQASQWCKDTCSDATPLPSYLNVTEQAQWKEVCKSVPDLCTSIADTDVKNVTDFSGFYNVALPDRMPGYCMSINETVLNSTMQTFCHDTMAAEYARQGCKDARFVIDYTVPSNHTNSTTIAGFFA